MGLAILDEEDDDEEVEEEEAAAEAVVVVVEEKEHGGDDDEEEVHGAASDERLEVWDTAFGLSFSTFFLFRAGSPLSSSCRDPSSSESHATRFPETISTVRSRSSCAAHTR